MSRFYSLAEIKEAVKHIDPIKDIEEGFIAYAAGQAEIPPVGELIFKDPPGDVHIKYGYLVDDNYYVIKIASGFLQMPDSSRYTSDGLLLLFQKGSGKLVCGLLDECYLTNIRTAAAGAVAAKYLAPRQVDCIGVLGTGVQGRMQVEYVTSVRDCRNLMVWGMDRKELEAYRTYMEPRGYTIRTTLHTGDIMENCTLIITATPSNKPLLHVSDLRKGTHITAIGSDTPAKQELDPLILQHADIVVADSTSQCLLRGEIHHALRDGILEEERILELGNIIVHPELCRTSDSQITVADLTGVAVQDIQIAKAVYRQLAKTTVT